MDALKWLWGYVKKYRHTLFAACFISIIFAICGFIHPIILGRFVDDVIYNGNKSLLFFYIVILLATVFFKDGINYLREILLEKTSQNVVNSIRHSLYAKLQSLDCNYFDHTRTGDLMSRLTMDTDAIRVLLAGTIPGVIMQIFYIIIGFVMIFNISGKLAFALFSVSPFIGLAAFLNAKYVKPTHVEIRESNARLNTAVQENIEGNRVVKAYANEDYEIEKFEKRNQDYMDTFMHHVHVWNMYAPIITVFVFVIRAVFILAGGLLVMKGSVTVGQFTSVNGCLWCITNPMANLANYINQYQQFNASCIKIRKLENEEPKIKNENIKKRDTGITGKITFKNVVFAYDGERVLKNISFTVNPGQTLAIIGPTGSGKSTILNLLARFYDPTYGTIYLDDINLKNIDLKTIHQNIASAMQDVFLFSDTIENNIAYGAPNATRDDVIRVAKMADAHSFIEELSEGYDTIIGERGTGLSGGQRQRISLARALLKNPSILVLDDTTSALDMETEFSIQENLKQTTRTKIIIAHRISSVKNADLILVLNQGNLIEWGTHDTLIDMKGYYYGVFEHQFGDFDNMAKYHIAHPAELSLAQSTKGGEH